jgi:hypothetical protein
MLKMTTIDFGNHNSFVLKYISANLRKQVATLVVVKWNNFFSLVKIKKKMLKCVLYFVSTEIHITIFKITS